MADKTLKITFSGISTLTPTSTSAATQKVYVVMPEARTDSQSAPRHHAFLYVPNKHLIGAPDPVEFVEDENLGRCSIYHIDHARVGFDPAPSPNPGEAARGPRYHVTGLPIQNRPGFPGVAPREDLRWMSSLAEIISPMPSFRAGCDPSATTVNASVAMVVELAGGLLKAMFPCATVQPQVFKIQDQPLDIPARVYASEFVVEMTYPETAGDVRLVFTRLAPGDEITGLDGAEELVLRWQNGRIDLRIGNDTAPEIRALVNLERCNIPLTPQPRDNDFLNHYKLFDVPPAQHAVPVLGTLHTEHNGCLGTTGGG